MHFQPVQRSHTMNRIQTILMSATRETITLGIFAAVLIATLALLSQPEALLAQPALPSEPTQAPIGPGLGVLAVAGGAYAMRRLRGRKGGESQEDSGAI
jgi:hypothetical protein